MTNLFMKEADMILATGGPGMVTARRIQAASPLSASGAGNTPAIIDDTGGYSACRKLHNPFQDL